jgi:hypothetical protein
MKILLNILYGFLLMFVGVWPIIKTEWFLDNFGRMEFFENWFSTGGGSRLGYKLVGLIFISLGILVATGLFNGFMVAITSPLTKYMGNTANTQTVPVVAPEEQFNE